MKRARTYGMIATEHGEVRIRHRSVANANQSAQAEVERLTYYSQAYRRQARDLEANLLKHGSVMKEIHAHWWFRLGRRLGIFKIGG